MIRELAAKDAPPDRRSDRSIGPGSGPVQGRAVHLARILLLAAAVSAGTVACASSGATYPPPPVGGASSTVSTVDVGAEGATAQASPSSSAEAPARPTRWPTKAATVGVPPCTGPFPVDVDVRGAEGPVRRGNVHLPGGRLATTLTWQLPTGRLQFQWPPSPRQLYRQGSRVVAETTIAQWTGSEDGRSVGARGIVKSADPTKVRRGFRYTLTLRPGLQVMPGWPCDKVQVKLTTTDGEIETTGYRIAQGSSVFDLGPLIGPIQDVAGPVPVARSIQCSGPDLNATMEQATPTVRYSRRTFPTAAHALRSFLASADATALDVDTLASPFVEYHVRTDATVHFEHFTDWNEHVAVVVTPARGAWNLAGFTSAC